MPVPRRMVWALHEHILGANPARVDVRRRRRPSPTSSTTSAPRSRRSGPQLIAERGWGATMVLTEPDAGSDVGAGPHQGDRSSPTAPGTSRASSGSSPPPSRTTCSRTSSTWCWPAPRAPAPAPRVCRCSSCPSSCSTSRPASSGERNGVFVTNVEHKMGLKASTTCELSLRPARRARQGLAGRRRAQRHRADVPGHRARPHDGRHQGDRHPVHRLPQRPRVRQDPRAGCRPDPDDRQDRAPGDHHAPPRRAPLADDPEGLRRGAARAVPLHRDLPGRGGRRGGARRRRRPGRAGSTTCCCRSSRASAPSRPTPSSTESLQTFGGSGYLQDYPIEQYIRDAKIDSLYEGTTAIQAQDFFFRKIVRDKGAALAHVVGRDREVHRQRDRRRPAEGRARAAGRRRWRTCRRMVATMTGYLMSAQQDADQPLQGGPRLGALPDGVGDLVLGWLLQRQAAVALAALDAGASGDERSFYEGKVAVASFFAKNFLPLLTSTREVHRHARQRHHGARRGCVLRVQNRTPPPPHRRRGVLRLCRADAKSPSRPACRGIFRLLAAELRRKRPPLDPLTPAAALFARPSALTGARL